MLQPSPPFPHDARGPGSLTGIAACVLLLALAPSAQAAPAGLSLSLGTESGEEGRDLLLDLAVSGFVVQGENTRVGLLPFAVSWDFLEPSGASKIIDRLELGLVTTERQLEGGMVTLGFTLPVAQYDYDMTLLDATAFGGRVQVQVLDEILWLGLGLDARYRARLVYWAVYEQHVVVGIPLSAQVRSPSRFAWFAEADLMLRANPVAWGHGAFFLDSRNLLRGGYTVLDGEEIDLRPEASLEWRYVGLAYPAYATQYGPQSMSEWTFALGITLLF